MNDNKITIAVGIFLIILCGLFTYKAMMEEFDFEARMRMLLPLRDYSGCDCFVYYCMDEKITNKGIL